MLTGPDMAYLGSRVTFWCRMPHSSPPITYKLLRDASVPVGAATAYEGNQSVPFPLKVTATSEGSYHCKAEAGGRTGVSNSIQLSVVSEYSTDHLLKVFESHFQTYPNLNFQHRRRTPEYFPSPSLLSRTRGHAWRWAAARPEALTCPTPGSSTGQNWAPALLSAKPAGTNSLWRR